MPTVFDVDHEEAAYVSSSFFTLTALCSLGGHGWKEKVSGAQTKNGPSP